MNGSRLFAIVPAAGHSRRMGAPKLLLPLGGTTVIGQLLSVLSHPEITARMVVVRGDDDALAVEVARHGGELVRPEAPPDMRASVSCALEAIRQRFAPRPEDGWLLIPGDHPLFDAGTFTELLARWRQGDCRILVPRHGNRRGHPTFFRWEFAGAVDALPADAGLNSILHNNSSAVCELEFSTPSVITDLDTPEDYERALRNADLPRDMTRPQ